MKRIYGGEQVDDKSMVVERFAAKSYRRDKVEQYSET